MTIDEKLQHFYEVSLDEAREDAAQAIQEHKEHLARTLEDHKQTSRQNAEAEIKAETGHVRREVNKALSAEQITLKETLFAEVKTKVQQFITTAEYDEYLCRRINEAVKFAGDDEIQIYLSSSDKSKANDLAQKTGTPLQVSKEDFIGGIRAEIPHKNILIDNSFSANLASMCREFKFDGGLKNE